jgi:hypothetical protein
MKKLVLLSIIIVLMSGVANAVEESIWDTSYNVMKFWRDGNSVTGEYMYDDGVLSGTMDGNIFKGWWRETDNAKECGPGNTWSGPVILRFSDDWKTFTGDWGYCPQQIEDLNINAPSRTWTGTRKDGITDYNQTECQNGGRYWCNGICQIQPCGTDITQEQCENTGKFWCDGICQLTQCDINSGTCSQSELDAKYEAGKQFCIDNPTSCGWTSEGFTQADLDAKYKEGYNAGTTACSNGSATPATISADLKIHIPQLNYVSPFGTMYLWTDFEYAGESNGSLIWKLTKYGQK